MEKYLANSYNSFFNTLRKIGYIKDSTVESLLVITFIYKLIFYEYKGQITADEYHLIERALNCLYGKNCILPFRDSFMNLSRMKIEDYDGVARKLYTLGTFSNEVTDALQARMDDLEARNNTLEQIYNSTREKVRDLSNTKVIKTKDHIMEVNDIKI